jgi:ubiquitin-protein ligase
MSVERWNKIIAKKLSKVEDNKTFQMAQIDKKNKYLYHIMFKLEGGHYRDQIHILSVDLKCGKQNADPTQWFPTCPPRTIFVTKMFHTNISSNGNICLDILQDKWTPMYNIDKLVENIILLLDDPAPSGNHLNGQAATLQQACQRNFKERSKILKKLHGEEFQKVYNECFEPFDTRCADEYKVNENIVQEYMPYFPLFNQES